MRKPSKPKVNPVEEKLNQRAREEIAVLDYLAKQTATETGISQALGIPDSRVRSILKTYVGDGMVRRVNCAWRLTSPEEQSQIQKKQQLGLWS